MDRHSPVHPLPEEIQQMGSSETVCRYCGVSYLVFHEFQQLQRRLRAVEQELESRRGSTEREQQLREELEELRTTHSQLSDRLCVLDQQLDGMRTKRADLEQQLETARMNGRHLGWRNGVQQQCLRVALSLLGSTHQGLQEVQQSFFHLQDVWKDWSTELLKRVHAESAQLTQESARTLAEASRLQSRLIAQMQDSAVLHKQNQEAWAKLEGMKELLVSFQQDLRHHSSKTEHLEQLLERRSEETEELRSRQMDLEKQCKEIQSSLSAALKDKEELEQRLWPLQEQLSAQRRIQQEAAQRHSETAAENRALKNSLKEALGEKDQLKRDSKQEALSHQEAVKKLEESWRWRLKELRMQMEIKVECSEAQLAQEQELRRKLEEELTLETKNNECLKLKHQRETEELHRKLPSLVQMATQDAEERALLLESKLQEVCNALAGQEEREAERRSALERELQRMWHEEQQGALQLEQLRQELQEQRREICELQEQNVLLQETVRQECEEREELTAALVQTREQLLAHHSGRTPPAGIRYRRDPRGPQGSRTAAARPPLVLPRLPNASR